MKSINKWIKEIENYWYLTNRYIFDKKIKKILINHFQKDFFLYSEQDLWEQSRKLVSKYYNK